MTKNKAHAVSVFGVSVVVLAGGRVVRGHTRVDQRSLAVRCGKPRSTFLLQIMGDPDERRRHTALYKAVVGDSRQ